MMNSNPSLHGIAQELIDRIVGGLDITSICSLRLTCKALGDRCCGQRYLDHFGGQLVDLTTYSLRRLCLIAAHPKFGPAVRTIAITAVVYDTSELERMLQTKRQRIQEKQGMFTTTTEPQASQDELDEAQRNLARLHSGQNEQQQMRRDESDVQLFADALRKLGTLEILTVEAAVDQGNQHQLVNSTAVRDWRPIWIRASQVFTIVMSAIERSEAAIQTLAMYNQSLRCSVPTSDINELAPMFRSTRFMSAAKHIRFIALSVSTKVATDPRPLADAMADMSEVELAYFNAGMGTNVGLLTNDDAAAISEDNYPGVACLLKQMPNLESLHLHLYNTLQGCPDSYEKVFSIIASEIVLRSLRRLTLRCFYCDEPSLVRFLSAHQNIEELELREIHLTSGSWSAIFEILIKMPSLRHVAFQNLWKPGGRMLSLGPKDPSRSQWTEDGKCCYHCLDGTKVHTRTFSQEEIQGERFEFAAGPQQPQMGSIQFHRWITRRKVECGPP
ncbi:MAG: hypothetical protein Q9169_007471 [Polycauliona sp. 2 TL-2023]